jgi:hypothetical protein
MAPAASEPASPPNGSLTPTQLALQAAVRKHTAPFAVEMSNMPSNKSHRWIMIDPLWSGFQETWGLTALYAALLIQKKTILDKQPLTINEEADHEQVEHLVVGFRHMESTWVVIFLMYRKVDPKLRTVDRFSALHDIELGEPFCWLVGDMTDLAGYNQLLAYLGHLLEEKMAEIDRPLPPSLMTATYFETVCRTISLRKCGKATGRSRHPRQGRSATEVRAQCEPQAVRYR